LSDGGFVIARALVSMTGWSIALVWIAYLLVGPRCPQKTLWAGSVDRLGRAILSPSVPNAEARKPCPSPARLWSRLQWPSPSWH